ncbi:hypothetical protein CKM354_000788100 [Cercospora kikuchii]|uniref:Aminoglycoside phosphotransferase domain-containing protein n=1 Tax=Cercospora kikuchii TaxID=84275 RepID=A0A9P3CQC2_9PEZI|nr:uncharacterized protein CKM354_000788100 [Cercospora kikuchii]GIZ44690.1 hypothetical protein CKM354_000788100 [Cercospora kikuchii]
MARLTANVGPVTSILRSSCSKSRACYNTAVSGSIARYPATGEEFERLFQYTSGRWLYNEKKRFEERKRVFNVFELKKLAAEAVSRDVKDIVYFDKLGEGAGNRAFLIRMRDGFSLVARIPYTSLQPRRLLVASEAATLDFLHSKGLSVPTVYAYSATSDNAAGVEYMFMEYSRGQQLSSIWFDMVSEQRRKFVESLVDLECRIGAISFPASGSLFFRRDLPAGIPGIAIDPHIDETSDSLVVGPSVAQDLWYGKRVELSIDRGPFREAEQVLDSGASKEIEYLRGHGRPLLPFDRIRRETFNLEPQSPATHIDSLEKYLSITEHILPRDDNNNSLLPTLRHPDLRPANIFESPDFAITSIIDWQHSVVFPALLNAGVPEDLNNSRDPVSKALETPRLPTNLESMTEDEQAEQLAILRERELHYEYITQTAERNPLHFEALRYPYSTGRRKLFNLASAPWQGDNIPLRSTLVFLKQHWEKFSNAPGARCPMSFSEAEEEECLRLDDSEREAEEQMKETKELLGIGPEGWVPNDHHEAAKEAVVKMKKLALECAETEMDRIAVSEHWVFDDRDEDEYL